jgi:hypothetical protein
VTILPTFKVTNPDFPGNFPPSELEPDQYLVTDTKTPVIVSAVRTPIGRYLGGLSSFSAPQLGAMVIRDAVTRAGVDPSEVEESSWARWYRVDRARRQPGRR